MRDPLKFKKRWEQFIRPNDKPLPVVAMRINDPERSPFRIQGWDPAETPTGLAELIGDDFPAPFHGFSSHSFWKRGSFRSGSNIGSSRSSAGVSGTFAASAPWHGIESSFCKGSMARSGSP